MARTFEEIRDGIENERAFSPELAAIDSSSSVSIWRLIRDVMARCMWVLEKLWDAFSFEIDQRIAAAVPGNDRWLAAEALKFQFGDALTFDPLTSRAFYAVEDPAKRIISQVAVQSVSGTAVVKVTKATGPLTSDELNAFRAYLNQIQFAGSNISALSRNADRLQLPMTVYYDASYGYAALRSAVEQAVQAFTATLPFNGVFRLSALVDAVQAVPGVKDVTLQGVKATPDRGQAAAVERVYFPISGQVAIDPEYPLSQTIAYAAE